MKWGDCADGAHGGIIRFADWGKVGVELLKKDGGKCLVNFGGIGIGWLRMGRFVKIEVFPAIKRV